MLDELLAIGSVFDWIGPLAAFAQDAANGPSHTFLIPHDCGLSGREIDRALKRQGIRTWGLMIVDNTLMVTVRTSQAAQAQRILDALGAPTETRFTGSHPGGTRRRPKPQPPRRNLLDGIDDFLDAITGARRR